MFPSKSSAFKGEMETEPGEFRRSIGKQVPVRFWGVWEPGLLCVQASMAIALWYVKGSKSERVLY